MFISPFSVAHICFPCCRGILRFCLSAQVFAGISKFSHNHNRFHERWGLRIVSRATMSQANVKWMNQLTYWDSIEMNSRNEHDSYVHFVFSKICRAVPAINGNFGSGQNANRRKSNNGINSILNGTLWLETRDFISKSHGPMRANVLRFTSTTRNGWMSSLVFAVCVFVRATGTAVGFAFFVLSFVTRLCLLNASYDNSQFSVPLHFLYFYFLFFAFNAGGWAPLMSTQISCMRRTITWYECSHSTNHQKIQQQQTKKRRKIIIKQKILNAICAYVMCAQY